jgi:adenylate cyclase class IV
MAREKEIKIKLKIPLNRFLKKIDSYGFKLERTVEQTDAYFDKKDWYLYESLAALRLRQVDGKDYSFSFKKLFYLPKRKDKYFIEEFEIGFPINKIDDLKKIFDRLGISYDKRPFVKGSALRNFLISSGYFDEQVMTKTRKIYLKDYNEIVIDNVTKVGTIIEIEAKRGEPLELVETILNKSEWKRNIEGTSFAWLRKVKGLKSHLTNLDWFEREPDWNVWENERMMYSKLNES